MNEPKIRFKNEEHAVFFYDNVLRCRSQDVYHNALIYCLGINSDTRKNIEQIYDFRTGCVKSECLQEGWITSGSAKVIRLAFNLYCNGMPSVEDYRSTRDKLKECECYTVEDIFCCGYAPWFWEAIKIRYPEYCN